MGGAKKLRSGSASNPSAVGDMPQFAGLRRYLVELGNGRVRAFWFAGSREGALLFVRGEMVRRIDPEAIFDVLIAEAKKLMETSGEGERA